MRRSKPRWYRIHFPRLITKSGGKCLTGEAERRGESGNPWTFRDNSDVDAFETVRRRIFFKIATVQRTAASCWPSGGQGDPRATREHVAEGKARGWQKECTSLMNPNYPFRPASVRYLSPRRRPCLPGYLARTLRRLRRWSPFRVSLLFLSLCFFFCFFFHIPSFITGIPSSRFRVLLNGHIVNT